MAVRSVLSSVMTCLLLLAGYYILRGRDSLDGTRALERATRELRTEVGVRSPESSAISGSGDRIELGDIHRSASEPVPQVHDLARPQDTESDLWERKYNGMSAAQLRAEMTTLAESLSSEAHRIGTVLMNDPARRVILDAIPKQEAEGAELHTTSMFVDESGLRSFCRVYMPQAEYPELYAIRRELRWINQERARRKPMPSPNN